MCGAHRERERTGTRLTADDKRASDAERDAVVSDLRSHAGEGRLSVDELDRRVAAALAATTRAELAALLGDLPRMRRRRDRTRERREHVRSYVSVVLLLVAIWAVTGAGYFWPVWVIVGWGFFVLPDAMALRGARNRRALT